MRYVQIGAKDCERRTCNMPLLVTADRSRLYPCGLSPGQSAPLPRPCAAPIRALHPTLGASAPAKRDGGFFRAGWRTARNLCIVADFVGLVAQSVEQRIENPCVGGSIPPQATKRIIGVAVANRQPIPNPKKSPAPRWAFCKAYLFRYWPGSSVGRAED